MIIKLPFSSYCVDIDLTWEYGRRKPYIFISAVISCVMALIIGFSHVIALNLLIVFLLLYAVGQAGDNVGTNGLVIEAGVKDGTIGKYQSIQWASIGVASVLTGILGGWISTKADYHLAYLIIAIFPATIAGLALYLKEEISNKTRGKNNANYNKGFYKWWVEKYGKEIADKKKEFKGF